MNGKLPLHLRNPGSPIAVHKGTTISAGEFAQAVASLSRRISRQVPEGRHVVNLCANRFNFLWSLASVVAAGQTNLLPPNRQPGTIANLAQRYPDTWLLHDGHFNDESSVPAVTLDNLGANPSDPLNSDNEDSQTGHVEIDAGQLAAVSFTSGSTGVPGANHKTWGMLLEGARVNAANMLISAPEGLNILATVPAQHMYGLELTITLPLAANVTMYSGQPLFPADIVDALNAMPQPRALVTTPQHLRTLLDSGLEFPNVDIVYSATAPLDRQTAARTEKAFDGRLTEIFGCSEIGSVARRRTACEDNWTPFSSMAFSREAEQTLVRAPHVPGAIPMQDQITLNNDGSFTLSGRLGDLINIAGKRGSFAQLNQILLNQEGVSDGVIFNPADENAGESPRRTRLAALVVSDNPDRKLLLRQLREYIDPVFLPRNVRFCSTLPRNDNGKLPRQALLALWEELKQQS